MTYEDVRSFSALWGLLYFTGLFALALVYALWPRNRETFERAAQMPLMEDDSDERR